MKQSHVACAALCDVDQNILNERAAELENLTGKRPALLTISGNYSTEISFFGEYGTLVVDRGGYLHDYSEDLSQVFGEIHARKTMIWLQSATPQMRDLYLNFYKAWVGSRKND